jgi:hypothetical protein
MRKCGLIISVRNFGTELMTELQVRDLVDQLTKQQAETLERLARMHEETLARVESQQKELFQHSRKAAAEGKKKDLWDRLGTMAPITSALIIACTGAYFTYTYNQ